MTPTIRIRSATILALALCAAAALALLVLPGRSIAQARSVPCASARMVHPARGRGACVGSGAASRNGRKAHARPKGRRGHSQHPAARHGKRKGKRTAHKPPAKKRRNSPAMELVPASCEDGSEPVAGGGGRFTCDDGSEPGCEDGSRPVASRDGSQLECEVPAQDGASEARCEDGTSPQPAEGGQLSCDDESEPACEDGSVPTRSRDGTSLLCDAPASGKAGE